jgi:N-acetylglucosaminyl-diphospho-decaprenol L-rhamnosyltransferase
MLGCVILNYNDAETTTNLVQSIKSYQVMDYIIVVDNNSTDNSFLELKKMEDDNREHIYVIHSPKNGGYGYGNNVGIRYCKKLHCDYVLVANPDVKFSEESIVESLGFIKQHKDCAAVAPRMIGGGAIKFSRPIKDLTFSIMTLNKIFNPRRYPDTFYENKSWIYVDAIPGSLVLFDINKFSSVGLYDENVFLYHEEVIIGKRLAKAGFKSVILLKQHYYHYHSVSVKKNYKQSIKPKIFAMQSHYYYLQHYCHANGFVLRLFLLLVPIAKLEMFLWLRLKKS